MPPKGYKSNDELKSQFLKEFAFAKKLYELQAKQNVMVTISSPDNVIGAVICLN